MSEHPQNDLQSALSGVRADIDRIDGDILRLLNERARCAQKVGEIKAEFGDAGFIYRPEREAQVLRRLQELNPGPLPNENITFFFREVMSACLSLEQPLSIACLGPLGSFTCAAATKHFGHAARLLPQASIDDAFREVESGRAHYVVAPIENSTEGAVGRSMDILLGTPLKICGEVVLRIHQNLMTRAATLGEITKVYSHAQSLAQCHEWLNRNLPGVPRVSVASNSLAAQMAAGEPGAAAIAGRAASEQTGLPMFAENIEDEPNNTTRFLILGKHDAGVTGRDKTSLIMSAPNRTGALHELLQPLAVAGVSMCRLESRPAKNALWEYVFYVDIEGHRSEAPIAAALDRLAANAAYLKILGSYPVAVY
ncbi:prephenate dehydratase [Azonexus sp. R2A61]|uniref:prephenate dehydratase n=1 Tax=Azonexus sp. R2A61 TaxID=2744443 RepID=UPI001F1CFEEC|nr:prephenate dehydratase [Azonexus sp. R2A61]